jgi:hypothetical protein
MEPLADEVRVCRSLANLKKLEEAGFSGAIAGNMVHSSFSTSIGTLGWSLTADRGILLSSGVTTGSRVLHSSGSTATNEVRLFPSMGYY